MILNPKTISQSFSNFLESKDIATSGQDLYINRVPNTKNTQESIYWIISAGGNPISKLSTGEMIRLFAIDIYYRSKSGRQVDEKLTELNDMLCLPDCVQLEGFETIDVSVSQYPASQDLDQEDRQVGLLRVNIQTYKRSA